MIELKEYDACVSGRLVSICKEELEEGNIIKTMQGEELIILKKLEQESSFEEIRLNTLMKITLGSSNGIVETEYDHLRENNDDDWEVNGIRMTAYFPFDKKYNQLKEKFEENKK